MGGIATHKVQYSHCLRQQVENCLLQASFPKYMNNVMVFDGREGIGEAEKPSLDCCGKKCANEY